MINPFTYLRFLSKTSQEIDDQNALTRKVIKKINEAFDGDFGNAEYLQLSKEEFEKAKDKNNIIILECHLKDANHG